MLHNGHSFCLNQAASWSNPSGRRALGTMLCGIWSNSVLCVSSTYIFKYFVLHIVQFKLSLTIILNNWYWMCFFYTDHWLFYMRFKGIVHVRYYSTQVNQPICDYALEKQFSLESLLEYLHCYVVTLIYAFIMQWKKIYEMLRYWKMTKVIILIYSNLNAGSLPKDTHWRHAMWWCHILCR